MSDDRDRRTPADFLEQSREARACWDQPDEPPADPAAADQLQAATRDARRIMGEGLDQVIDVEQMGEREIALLFALAAAADRRGLRSSHGPTSPRPEVVDLRNRLRGHCDVCDARAHRLDMMLAQYGAFIFRARVCVRCRRFAPDEPLDDAA